MGEREYSRVDIKVKGEEHEFTICGDGHTALVTVNPCTGEVIIHNRDRLTEAAQIFWDAMMFEGKSMHHRIWELEKKIERIKGIGEYIDAHIEDAERFLREAIEYRGDEEEIKYRRIMAEVLSEIKAYYNKIDKAVKHE